MTLPTATVIISVYKDTEALSLILDALNKQTHHDFEIIVSEDGEDASVSALIKKKNHKNIKHLTQADNGWRKNAALNKSISNANGDYLVFIDGDCIPHRKFIETHLTLAERKKVLTGRRCNIGQKIGEQLRNKKLEPLHLESIGFYITNFTKLVKDSNTLEDAIYVTPHSFFARKILPKISKVRGILGCNFSCFKEDIIEINGFDEDYSAPNFGEDTDLHWRFNKIGIHIKSVRNMAILYHLRHPVKKDAFEKNRQLMEEKIANGEFFPKNGLIKHQSSGT